VGGLERSEDIVWKQLALRFERIDSGIDAFPFDGNPRGLDRANGGFGNFGSDPVSGDQRYLVSHKVIIEAGAFMVPDFSEERRQMVERQLSRRGIRDPRVLDAMAQIPREQFVPAESHFIAYFDEPIDIGFRQTISQPYMTALMAELLELEGSDNVLEVGTGSGYAAAVLGALARRVVTVELIPRLAAVARQNLARTGRDRNVIVVSGDGSLGYAELAPYDAISVAAGAPAVPQALLDQLKDPGRLVIPVGERRDQELRVIQKCDGQIESRVATLCRFVPLRGGEGWK
jgi:protein-L-isoaspartate(D-aspartate) O-methyltransferase